MLNTNKQIKKMAVIVLFALFTIPNLASADNSYGFDNGGYDTGGWGSWGGGSSAYDYVPTYGYTPIYSDYYNAPSTYSSPSYGYTPSYSGSSYSGYSLPSYRGSTSASPASNYNDNYSSNSNKNTNTASSNSTSSSSATAINNNVNNVYVYTNPTGNAVVHNPGRIALNGYCIITPQNARLGQTVVATAYASGGIGNYTYSWGGDIYSATGASTSFTSYTPGTKNIVVTIRSDQEIITKSCDVTFGNDTNNDNLTAVCYANPTNANINQVVTWSVTSNGGTGAYSYSWSGTDGLTGNNQYTSRQYNYPGTKTASVTVSSGGRSITTNCSMNVSGYAGVSYNSSSVNLTPNITSGTPVSGVYLSQLPATGLSLTFVHYMIALMAVVLAAVFTFIYQARKRLIVENI